jgi:hypothetical protein
LIVHPGLINMADCDCFERILNGGVFCHYGSIPDRMGTTFDDFGYAKYQDETGKEYRLIAHKHLGVFESYSHRCERLHDDLTFVSFEKDNSVIPTLQELIRNNMRTYFEME